jgi:glucokinase
MAIYASGRSHKTSRRGLTSYPKTHKAISEPAHSGAGGHIVGVDIGGSNLRVALADTHGTVLGKWGTSTKETSSPAMVIAQIQQGVQYLFQAAGVRRDSLLAVAAGAPGITNADTGVVFATSYLRGWRNVPLGNLLREALNAPTSVENDVKVAAIGENWLGAARGFRDFAFLAIGTGIAAGIFVNGQLVHGKDWAAGEVGYMLVPGTLETPAKRGDPGALESAIGGEGVSLQWLRSRGGRRMSLAHNLTATEIFDEAHAGNPLAKRVLDRSSRMLAYAVYNISLVLNCPLFVLGGGVGLSVPLLRATRRVLKQYKEPVQPKLALSSLGQNAQLMGPIKLALDKLQPLAVLK